MLSLVESSAPSIDFFKALSPPAIKPTTKSSETPNVGGHSEASKTPNLPLVPAPIYTSLPDSLIFSKHSSLDNHCISPISATWDELSGSIYNSIY